MTDPTPQITPTRDEAVREIALLIEEYDPKNSDWYFRRTVIREILSRLASAPAPASGGVDAVAVHIADVIESIRPSTFMHQREHGDLYGYCERTRQALYEALSPAATPVSEAEPVAWQVQFDDGNWSKAIYSEDEIKGFRQTVITDKRLLYALAKPASSPAGGDVREVKLWDILDWIANMSTDQPVTNMANAGLKLFPNGRPAALSQSTSAGRVGE